MTAPAQLGGGTSAPTRSLPAPPAPVPPLAPPMRERRLANLRRERILTPAVREAREGRPPASWSGRVAKVGASVMVTLAVVGALGWLGQTGSGPGVSPAETVVTRVGAGETVWDVALRVAPQADQSAVVERIRELNGIVGSAITPGQQLRVPDRR